MAPRSGATFDLRFDLINGFPSKLRLAHQIGKSACELPDESLTVHLGKFPVAVNDDFLSNLFSVCFHGKTWDSSSRSEVIHQADGKAMDGLNIDGIDLTEGMMESF